MKRIVILICWLLIWQLAAMIIRNRIIFVGPLETGKALAVQIMTVEFWRTVGLSFIKIALGFLTAFFTGILLAAVASGFSLFGEFLEPFMGLIQSVPVASFVILILIWFGSSRLSVLISFLVTLPIIYRNVLSGISQTDVKLLEMARIFSMGWWEQMKYLYRPAVFPELVAGCRVAVGMAWKSGVAAEIIGVAAHSIGEKLYLAKIYLSTAELFAWSFVIILLSKLFEMGFLGLLRYLNRDLSAVAGGSRAAFDVRPDGAYFDPEDIRLVNVSKAYGEKKVLENASFCLEKGKRYCLMGESGVGKTTLLRLIMGLERPETGEIVGTEGKSFSVVFQEDRLIEFLDGASNIKAVQGRRRYFGKAPGSSRDMKKDLGAKLLSQLLNTEDIYCAAACMSGGMKRRVALVRALACPSDFLLLDEPFSGLDAMAKERAISAIKKYQKGRTVILVSHQEEDAVELEAEIICFPL